MGTQDTKNHGWDKPVFPSSSVDTELDSLFDQIDSDVWLRGLEADRPAAETVGRLYVATDTSKHFYDNGSSWDDITPGGSSWSVSNSGTEVLVGPSDLNFGTGLSVTDDGDGSVTIDGHAKYTDSEAVTAVNAETSLDVSISGDADTVDGINIYFQSTEPTSPSEGDIWIAP